jgi:hypothetical protein
MTTEQAIDDLVDAFRGLLLSIMTEVSATAYERGLQDGLARRTVVPPPPPDVDMSISITSLMASSTSFVAKPLFDNGIHTLGELIGYHKEHLSEGGLMRIRGFGIASFRKLKHELERRGIELYDTTGW